MSVGASWESLLYYETIKPELNGRLIQGVGVMKDKELCLEETETSHTLGGAIINIY
jgi:hypothetical protein